MPTPTPLTETTPAERTENFLNNTLPKITAKFKAYTTNEQTGALVDMVTDVDNSGITVAPPLDPD